MCRANCRCPQQPHSSREQKFGAGWFLGMPVEINSEKTRCQIPTFRPWSTRDLEVMIPHQMDIEMRVVMGVLSGAWHHRSESLVWG